MQQELINIDNISLIKNNKKILDNISFKIKENDFITIIGPNGAGKSMLLKCIMNFYKPQMGSIQTKKNIKIGYMPQRIHHNFMLPLNTKRFLTIGHKIDKNHFEKIIVQTGIEELLDTSIHSLSGGQMQKVLIARALLKKPQLLILDEPAQNLDISSQISFYRLLDDLYKQNQMSILMVSHDLHFIMSASKQVICLFRHICCSGMPHVVAKDPEFLNLFGESTTNLLWQYEHTAEHTHHKH